MITQKLHRLLFGTVRRQLIVGVAVVHALMMALFIGDLTRRQEALLLERQTEQAVALATTLATSSAGWIAAHDVSGLQELVESQRRYPEVQFAILLGNEGQVLAHTDRSRIGQYVQDLPSDTRQMTVSRNPALVDVIVPAMIAERHVGWARVGIGQRHAGQRLAEITRDGILYAVVAIIIGSILAWIVGRRLTRRLAVIQDAMDGVRSGDSLARSSLDGSDEVSHLSAGFNRMLDAMAQLNAEVRDSEERFRSLFENSPVSIWEEDFSGGKRILDVLKEQGVSDIEAYLDQHPEVVRQCAEAVRILDVNQATLRLHEAVTKEELLKGLPQTFTPESYATFREELVALWYGRTELVRDTVVTTLGGAPRDVTLFFSISPGCQRTLSKVMVSLIDITERKQAETALRKSEQQFRGLVENWPDEIARYDRHCRHVYVNPAMETTLGAAREIIGCTPAKSFPGTREIAYYEEKIQEVLETGITKDFEMCWTTPAGRPGYRMFRLVAERDADGAISGVLAIARDISKRKEAEEELNRLNAELEQRVMQRTSELENINKELERLNRMFVGRELRMVELKERIRELEQYVREPNDNK